MVPAPNSRHRDRTPGRAAMAALAMALLGLALALLWRGLGDAPESASLPEAAAPPSRDEDRRSDIATATTFLPSAPQSSEAEPSLPEPADLRLPMSFEAELRLVDAFGLPAKGAYVFVAPRGCGFSLWPTATDAEGRVTIRCRGRSGELPVWLAILHRGKVEPLRHVTLSCTRPLRLEAMATG